MTEFRQAPDFVALRKKLTEDIIHLQREIEKQEYLISGYQYVLQEMDRIEKERQQKEQND